MAEEKKNLQITGTQNRTYDLDEIEKQNRENSDLELRVQVYEYANGESPNPTNPAVGQIRISKYVMKAETITPEISTMSLTSDTLVQKENELLKSKPTKKKKSDKNIGLELTKIK